MDPKLSLCQQGYPICWMLLFSAGSLSGLGLLHTVWERNIDSPVGSIVVLLLEKQEVLGLGLLPDGHYTDKAKGYWKNEEREEVWEYQKGECGTHYPGLEKELWKSYSDAVLRTWLL